MDLSPEDRLVVVQKKQLCYLCFRHADDQPCTLQSLPACSIGGCVHMHSKLLHEALQKEETRAIVIEVEEGPEEPGEDEEFYAMSYVLCLTPPTSSSWVKKMKTRREGWHPKTKRRH